MSMNHNFLCLQQHAKRKREHVREDSPIYFTAKKGKKLQSRGQSEKESGDRGKREEKRKNKRMWGTTKFCIFKKWDSIDT